MESFIKFFEQNIDTSKDWRQSHEKYWKDKGYSDEEVSKIMTLGGSDLSDRDPKMNVRQMPQWRYGADESFDLFDRLVSKVVRDRRIKSAVVGSVLHDAIAQYEFKQNPPKTEKETKAFIDKLVDTKILFRYIDKSYYFKVMAPVPSGAKVDSFSVIN